MLMPNSLALLGSAFASEARGGAIFIWASMGAVLAGLILWVAGFILTTLAYIRDVMGRPVR